MSDATDDAAGAWADHMGDHPPNRDRVGERYRSKRRGRIWKVERRYKAGIDLWSLWPDWGWPDAIIGTAGGTKALWRSSAELDDPKKWELVT